MYIDQFKWKYTQSYTNSNASLPSHNKQIYKYYTDIEANGSPEIYGIIARLQATYESTAHGDKRIQTTWIQTIIE